MISTSLPDPMPAGYLEGNTVVFPDEIGRYPLLVNNVLAAGEDGRWFEKASPDIRALLSKYGAILFRGFPVDGTEGFNKLLPYFFSEQIEYRQRTSPRRAVLGNVYTSTDHPSDQVINMHTESSYASPWPGKICFYAAVLPDTGGETPIADTRRVKDLMSPEIVEEFDRKGIMYVRNIMPGVGMSWQEIYQVDNKRELEDMLDKAGMRYTWVAEDHLRVKWIRPAFRVHPATGEKVWFNHAYFYSKHLLDDFILEVIDEEDLPFTSYFGDGSEIGKETIDQIRNAYQRESIFFKWEKNDVLLMDNMLFAHGRMPFGGPRKILVAMGDPVSDGI